MAVEVEMLGIAKYEYFLFLSSPITTFPPLLLLSLRSLSKKAEAELRKVSDVAI